MPSTGLSRPYVAKYKDNGNGTVTYSDGRRFSKAVETHVAPKGSSSNPLYGDNGIAENDNRFSDADLSIKTTTLPLEDAALIFGLKVKEVTLEGESAATGKRVRFGSGQEIPYIGYGVVVEGQEDNVGFYMALILFKVQMANPGDDYVTRGETISWQVPSLDGTVMRSDALDAEDPSEDRPWRDWATFKTEAQAEAYIRQVLNVADEPEG